MTEQEIIESTKGKELETPECDIRVFHISDPKYTYSFERREGSEVLVVDDNNGQLNSKKTLKVFTADELVNVVVFRNALLKSHETEITHTSNALDHWKRIGRLPGGDTNPFKVPFGPTMICLSAEQLVDFVNSGEVDYQTNSHLADCKECLDRVNRFKKVVR